MKKSYQHPSIVCFPVSFEDIVTLSQTDAADLGNVGSVDWGDLPYFN